MRWSRLPCVKNNDCPSPAHSIIHVWTKQNGIKTVPLQEVLYQDCHLNITTKDKIPLMLPLIRSTTSGINLLGQAYELMKQSGPGGLWDQEMPGAELTSHMSSIELPITSFSGNVRHGNTANKPQSQKDFQTQIRTKRAFIDWTLACCPNIY